MRSRPRRGGCCTEVPFGASDLRLGARTAVKASEAPNQKAHFWHWGAALRAASRVKHQAGDTLRATQGE